MSEKEGKPVSAAEARAAIEKKAAGKAPEAAEKATAKGQVEQRA